ncbi:MAG: DUF58 domain-containing protein [Treponema sp.]|jgi:hypothetical protein|nr:DUF58 domain-containing protein [Treponema sp.]
MKAEPGAPKYAVLWLRGTGLLNAGIAIIVLLFLFVPIYIVQFVCLFLLFIVFGSRAYSEYLVRHIGLHRRDTELRVFRHEWVSVELLAENYGRLPALMSVVSDTPGALPVFRDNKTLRTFWPRSRTSVVWQGYCSERGVFTLGPAVFRGADPLGLFPFRLTAPLMVTLFVYPAPGMIALKNPGGIPLGTLISPNPLFEDMTRCRSLRDYHPGDEQRRINWKATARSRRLTVNEYEPTVSYPLVIFLNADSSAYSLKKREIYYERAIEAAAALCLMASRERQELGIIIYTGQAPLLLITPSAFTLIPILERLAGLRWRTGETISGDTISGDTASETGAGRSGDGTEVISSGAAALLDRGKYLPYGTRLVYAGPDFSEAEYRALEHLRRYHLSLEYLIIDERSIPVRAHLHSRRYQMKEGGYEII